MIDHHLLFFTGIKDYLLVTKQNGNFENIWINPYCKNKSGEKTVLSLEGLEFTMQYSKEDQTSIVSEINDASHKVSIASDSAVIWMNTETKVSFERNQGFITYQINDGTEIPVSCLTNEKMKNSAVFKERLIKNDTNIIGLITVSNVGAGIVTPQDLSQKSVEKDILFTLNPETGESSVLYDTGSNQKRIVGYKDEILYLLDGGTIYKKDLSDKGWNRKEKIFTLPDGGNSIRFTWVADNLIVFDTDEKEVLFVYPSEP